MRLRSLLSALLVLASVSACGVRARRRPRPPQTYASATDPPRVALEQLVGRAGRGPRLAPCTDTVDSLVVRMDADALRYPRAYGRPRAERIAIEFHCGDDYRGVALRSLGGAFFRSHELTLVTAVHELTFDSMRAMRSSWFRGETPTLLLPVFDPCELRVSGHTSLTRLWPVRERRAFVVEEGAVLALAPNAALDVVVSVQRARSGPASYGRPIAELAVRLRVGGTRALFFPELDDAELSRVLEARCPSVGRCPALAADALILMGLARPLSPRLAEAVGASLVVAEPDGATDAGAPSPSTHWLSWSEGPDRWHAFASPEEL